jgi:hypothetical protein
MSAIAAVDAKDARRGEQCARGLAVLWIARGASATYSIKLR